MTQNQSAVVRGLGVVGVLLLLAGVVVLAAVGGPSPALPGVIIGGIGIVILCAAATIWATLAPAGSREGDRSFAKGLAITVGVVFVAVMGLAVIDVFLVG